jgi:class 3 adenylate cyclase
MKQLVERRLAAILAADVAGYSRMMWLDQAGTAQVSSLCRLDVRHRNVISAKRTRATTK